MLPYLKEIIIEESDRKPQYSIAYLEMVESFDPISNYQMITPNFKNKVIVLTKNHTIKELEKKFSDLVLDIKSEFCISRIEGNTLKGDFFDIIKNEYTDIDILPKRIIMWSNYLHSKMRSEFINLVVHPDLYDLIQIKLEVDSNSRINLYKNQHLPKEKIVFISNQKDRGCPIYLSDGEFNDIIFLNNDMISIVNLISPEDIRDQKINKILE
jgi:hypothetical protein